MRVEIRQLSNCYPRRVPAWNRHFTYVEGANLYKHCVYNGDIQIVALSGPVAKLAIISMKRTNPCEEWRDVLVQTLKYKHLKSYVEGTVEAPLTEWCSGAVNRGVLGRRWQRGTRPSLTERYWCADDRGVLGLGLWLQYRETHSWRIAAGNSHPARDGGGGGGGARRRLLSQREESQIPAAR